MIIKFHIMKKHIPVFAKIVFIYERLWFVCLQVSGDWARPRRRHDEDEVDVEPPNLSVRCEPKELKLVEYPHPDSAVLNSNLMERLL